ncbi:hypothetical protein ANCCAN_01077 [Ancylostoma caninum]|uniref:Uncharacterized protein n=1 Tax=Ancylostoma caninum TaxID=29170 RepID=A0A368H7X3_ANCCA|nr:hypothetical protein ANCCAN_01077 [Ancylostoma caninum]
MPLWTEKKKKPKMETGNFIATSLRSLPDDKASQKMEILMTVLLNDVTVAASFLPTPGNNRESFVP